MGEPREHTSTPDGYAAPVERDRSLVGVTMGDPGGIGPEVIVRALAEPGLRARARWAIYGSHSAMLAAAHALGVEPFWWRAPRRGDLPVTAAAHEVLLIDHDGEHAAEAGSWRHEPTRDGGAASFAYVENALADAARTLRERGTDATPSARSPAGAGAGLALDAVTTAPISKEAWAAAGRGKWPGHTELVADRLGAKRARMMFVSPDLWVMLATTHIPLTRVADELTLGRVLETIELCDAACRRMGVARPRVAVCGLNPHAGERGLMGADEARVIEPAIAHAARQGIEASGPYPADTVFARALRNAPAEHEQTPRRFDAVVAMYHDQGLIPVKLLGFDRAVNLTVGPAIPRTSPDHGTAFDIAGRGTADPGSTAAALELAATLGARPAVASR
jgi:4-hydroxythreonine-4-phosphate dehydrogenase